MNKMIAISTDPRTGLKVEAPYDSWACNLVDQYSGAQRAIEAAHGFKPCFNSNVSFRFV